MPLLNYAVGLLGVPNSDFFCSKNAADVTVFALVFYNEYGHKLVPLRGLKPRSYRS